MWGGLLSISFSFGPTPGVAVRGQQGPPGKVGPPGPHGIQGPTGQKGQKGDTTGKNLIHSGSDQPALVPKDSG